MCIRDRFVAVGVDTTLLVRAATDLAAHFKAPRPGGTPATAAPAAISSAY